MKSSMASTARPDQDAVDFLPRPLPVCPRIVNSILMAAALLGLVHVQALTDPEDGHSIHDRSGDVWRMNVGECRAFIKEMVWACTRSSSGMCEVVILEVQAGLIFALSRTLPGGGTGLLPFPDLYSLSWTDFNFVQRKGGNRPAVDCRSKIVSSYLTAVPGRRS